ncbi:MAG: hypothetical protein EOP01_00955, partial [Propionibacteriaceae bacterium]
MRGLRSVLVVTPTDAPAAGRPISRGRRLLRVPAVLLAVGWFLVVPVLGVRALLWTMTFFGEQPTPADRAGCSPKKVIVQSRART